MSKKLGAEIEKCLRESQTNMQIYDLKWRELKCYNEATANPDWAVLGSGVIKCNAPETVILSGLRSKKIQSGPSVITVDISNMSEKQVAEVKEKLKNELESLMKKVYRSRQQLMDWILHADLRQTGFTKEHLVDARKEIESRHRKGKIYYLKNVSSEDTSNEQASQFNEVIQWMQEYADQLRDKSDQFTAELEGLTRKAEQNSSSDRLPLLNEAIEMYSMHADRLDELLRGIRNNTISIQKGGDPSGDPSEESVEAGGGGGDGVEALLKSLAELKDILTPFVEENDDLMYVVDSDIYDDLGIVTGVGKQEEVEAPPPVEKSPPEQSTSPVKPASPIRQSPSPAPAWPRPQEETKVEPPPRAEPPRVEPPVVEPNKGLSYRTILQHAKPAAEPAPPQPDQIAENLRLSIDERLRFLESKLVSPGWSDGGRLVLSEGVTSNVCDADLLHTLSLECQDRLLNQVEKLLSQNNHSSLALPVLVLDSKVAVLVAKRSWRGELAGITPDVTKRILEENSLLFVDEGSKIEVLATVPRERWTYGRLVNDKSKQGWFPTHVIQR